MKIHDLSVSERIVLVEKLWDSIADEEAAIGLSKHQELELDRRLQAFLDDQQVGSSWAEVKQRIIGKT